MIAADHASASTAQPMANGALMTTLNGTAPAAADATRVLPARPASAPRVPPGPFRLGACTIDPPAGSIRRPDRPVAAVETRVMQVLLKLAGSPGELVTRRALLDAIWYPGADCDAALTRTVTKLRRALGDTRRPPRYVQTIHGHGYRLLFEPVAANAAQPADPGARNATSRDAAADTLGLGNFFSELQRRRVIRVASAYLVIGWLAIQVGETVFDPLGVPEWWLTALVVTVILGFPMAVALAWAVQLTSQGAVLEIPVVTRRLPRKPARARPRRLLLAAALLVVAGLFSYGVVITATEQPVAAHACGVPS